ncbi:hypothetical protein J2S22_005923 [Rhodoplanes tepidamans]|nr:hypothetical protein [Rhodoplanes tepidamans]
MTSIALSDSGLRAMKRALVARFPNEKSSHLSEALAAACGFGTYAALRAAVRANQISHPSFVLLDESAFLARREKLTGRTPTPNERNMLFDTLPIKDNSHILRTSSSKFRNVDYSKSCRLRAWRNAMVAGINASLARQLFSLRPGDNRWPGVSRDNNIRQQPHVFRFEIEEIPAIASLWDAGWDEISVHVAFWPTDEAEHRIPAANAGFHAGELFASGWLERRNGAWLQVASDSGRNWSFHCRKQRLSRASAITVHPAGYADRGSFIL